MNALYVDQYCLTMAQSFWKHSQDEETVFELFVRRLPKARDFLLVAGLGDALDFLDNFSFTESDLDYLRSLEIYEEGFLGYLRELRFEGTIFALPEGTVIANDVPIIQVIAPRIQATLVESALLTILNHQTLVATKTSRIVRAAAGRTVWDFSLRRLHSPATSIGVARAAYIAGAAGTATMEAGKLLGIPTSGTMAHHFVMSFGRQHELDAFKQFLEDYPGNGILLVDTYEVKQGIRNAIRAAKETGVHLQAIRLDSGDLLVDSIWARETLDKAGCETTQIIASNDLDEYTIEKLVADGAKIDSFGVGTRLGVAASPGEDIPALGIVFKIVAQTINGEDAALMKFSENKVTNPGRHQVFRQLSGEQIVDTIGLYEEKLDGQPMLRCYMRSGVLNPDEPDLDLIRANATRELEQVETHKIISRRSELLQGLVDKIKAESAA